jgi:23S rRNA (guanine745-N1)-methyltransferase
MLLCTVRECRQALIRDSRRMICPRGHSFDIARSGYVNLLQPQERRSKNPGDTAEAVAARRRLHDRGVSRPLLQGIATFTNLTSTDVVLDAGCGEGFYLGTMAQESGCSGVGVDISIPAIDAAARKYPDRCQWVVANADRMVPCEDQAFTLVLSITARMNVAEFRRVLRPDGRLLVALPAPDDLIELRGKGREDRIARTVEEFSSQFALTKQDRVTTCADLDATGVEDVLHSIYRPMQPKEPSPGPVTFSFDLLLLKAKPRPSR